MRFVDVQGPWQRYYNCLGSLDAEQAAWARALVKAKHYRCEGCGFNSVPTNDHPMGMLEVCPPHGNYDHRTDHWDVLCSICHAQRLALPLMKNHRAILIGLPYLSADQLANVLWPLFGILYDQEHLHHGSAKEIYSTFENAGGNVNSVMSFMPVSEDNAANNLKLVELLSLTNNLSDASKTFINDLKILPVLGELKTQAEYFQQHVFSKVPVSEWVNLNKVVH